MTLAFPQEKASALPEGPAMRHRAACLFRKKIPPCTVIGATFVSIPNSNPKNHHPPWEFLLKGVLMERFCSPARFRGQIASRLLPVCFLIVLVATPALAQSTFGAILGAVRDSSGALVTNARVTLINTGTMALRTMTTDASGNYAFKNIDVGQYELTITAPGFEKTTLPEIALTARETRRMDATLKPGAETQTVIVVDNAAPVITTDVSNLAETKVGDELVELPVAIYSRSTGSTSPISTLTTESGVQTDDSGEPGGDGHHRRAAQRHHRRHLLGRRRVLGAGERDVPVLQFH